VKAETKAEVEVKVKVKVTRLNKNYNRHTILKGKGAVAPAKCAHWASVNKQS